jgi:hypothetical protein
LQRIVEPTGGAAPDGCAARLATGAAGARLTAGGTGWRGRRMLAPPCEAHALASPGAAMSAPSAHRATALAGGAAAGAGAAGRTESGGGLTRPAATTGASVGLWFAARVVPCAGGVGAGAVGGRSTAGACTGAGGVGTGRDAGAWAAACVPMVSAAPAMPIAQARCLLATGRDGGVGRIADNGSSWLMASP